MGKTSITNEQHNCCHFCDELCRWLGVGAIPEWTMRLAGQGADLSRHLDWTSFGEEADNTGIFKGFCCSRGMNSTSSAARSGDSEVLQITYDGPPETSSLDHYGRRQS